MNLVQLFLVLVTSPSLVPAACEELVALAQEGEQSQEKKPARSLQQLRADLAEIQLEMATERDFAGVRPRLEALVTALQSLDGRAGAEAADLRAQAEDALRTLLAKLDAKQEAGEDRVDAAVRAALQNGNPEFVLELGPRAAPTLAALVRERPDVMIGETGSDPLFILLELDPRAGDALLREMAGQDGFFWKKRAVRAIVNAQPWDEEELWTVDSPPRWLGPGVQAVLERFVEDPDVGDGALRSLGIISASGGPYEVFRGAVERAVFGRDAARRGLGVRMLESQNGGIHHLNGVFLDLWEAMVRSDDEQLRVWAAEHLAKESGRTALAERVDDPSVKVRGFLANWLRGVRASHRFDPWSEGEQELLARLLADESADVRREAINAIAESGRDKQTLSVSAEESAEGEFFAENRSLFVHPLPKELYLAVAACPQPYERSAAAELAVYLPAATSFEVIEGLAADPARVQGSSALVGRSVTGEVAAEVAQRMGEYGLWKHPELALRIASRLLDNEVLDARQRQNLMGRLQKLKLTREGYTALVRWLLERDDPEVLRMLSVSYGVLARIDPDLLVAYMQRLSTIAPKDVWGWLQALTSRPGGAPGVTGPGRRGISDAPDAEVSAAYRSCLDRRDGPLVFRLGLALLDPVRDGAEWSRRLAALCAEPGWAELDLDGLSWLPEAVRTAVHLLSRADANQAILAFYRSPVFPEAIRTEVDGYFETAAPGGVEVARLMLERYFDEPGYYDTVGKAISQMGSVPELRDDALIERALGSRFDGAAWRAIGELRDPKFYPLLRKAIEEDGDRGAARALLSYLDEEAVELLLLAARKVGDHEERDRYLAHVEKIREYLDAQEAWAARKVRGETRATVVARLVEQLDDASVEVRVQAIRALATFEAVETMPRLIELVTSDVPAVADAARAALDRLNRVPEKE